MKLAKHRQLVWKILIVLLLFGGFMIYLNFARNSGPTFEVNEEFKQLESEEKVMEKISNHLTNSILPVEHHLFSEVDEKALLLNEQRTLKIEKVWYQFHSLFVIYSIDLRQDDKRDLDIPYLTFPSLTLHSKKDAVTFNVNKTTHSVTNWLPQGYVYDYRMYRGIEVNLSTLESDADKIQEITQWNDIDQLTIADPEMIHGARDNGADLDQIVIDTSLQTKYAESLKTFALNETTNVTDNLKIKWDELELTTDHSNLTFHTDDTNKTLQGITLAISSNDELAHEKNYAVQRNGDEYKVNLNQFPKTPDLIKLEVRGLVFTDDSEPLTYTITNNELEKVKALKKNQDYVVKKRIGSHNGMGISFGGISTSNPRSRSASGDEVVGLILQLDNVPEGQFRTWFQTVTENMQNLKYNHVGSNSERPIYTGPSIEIRNKRGELAESRGSSSTDYPEKEIQKIYIRKDFIERSSEIELTLSSLPNYQKGIGSKTTIVLASKEDSG